MANKKHPEKPNGKSYYIESYGCAMNFNDSEIVASILGKEGYAHTDDFLNAELILINTCSIREKAEETVRKRLSLFNARKERKKGAIVGVLGCMAERLKAKLLEEEKLVDIVCGPDAYRDLPNLIAEVESGQKAVNVLLSREETYADISPVRLDNNGINSFVSIMRGCDNMCTFCVVPFTRGRERSRNAHTIVGEAQALFDNGYREVTLLGQNVDSYKWRNPEKEEEVSFANLLRMVAQIDPKLRVRFSTSHPKDITDDVLYAMAENHNVCNNIHLPVQSGNSRILKMMNRTYDREWYLSKVNRIREILPDCGITSDIITGFCTESEQDHKDTLSLLEIAKYNFCYMYFYSERPGTLAARKFEDDVSLADKKRRLAEIIAVQRPIGEESNKADVGKTFEVLVEKVSKKSADDLCGRNSCNKMVVFPKGDLQPGQYVNVKITDCNSATLFGEVVEVLG